MISRWPSYPLSLVLLFAHLCGQGQAGIESNGYFSVEFTSNRIYSIRCDASGGGNYGLDLIADGQFIPAVEAVALADDTLTLDPLSNQLSWPMPFLKAGYYDSDANLNYPNDHNTLGATELVLPFRHLVGSSGQVTRIEHFKRLPAGTYFLTLNIQNGSRLLMRSDASQNWDLETHWPGVSTLTYDVRDTMLSLRGGPLTGPVTFKVLPRGNIDFPTEGTRLPSGAFSPDPTVEFAPTGKSLPGSQLLTELLRQGIYWAPGITSGGDWVLGAVETHRFDDPQSWYLRELRGNLLHYLGYLGYDRFGHFGYLYPWNQYPDYGAGGLLNVPPGNAPWDMRALHMNSLWITCIAEYVLATGDIDFLQAKRARWLATNGGEPQPICGGNLSRFDYVLASGDVRLDGQPATVHHSLGQTFTANAPFSEVRAYLGNPSLTESNSGRMALYSHPGGDPIAETDFSITPNLSREVALPAGSQLPSGTYFLEVTDDNSGVRYFGPGLVWWTETDSDYAGGEATIGPFQGNVLEELQTLFGYMVDHMGVSDAGFPYYQNDPEYNIANHKSGRHGVSTTTSFWEAAGGGFDFFEAIWFPAACRGLSELSELIGDTTSAMEYRAFEATAVEGISERFWQAFNDGGFTGNRFHACEDWNGTPHDFGFTYYNLEAAARGVASATQTREILWWLDRGPWSSDGGTTWNEDIYSIWEAAPPFNTRANSTWLNVTGTLPYMEVVTNGGARLDIAARDLQARATHLSIDNAHERNLKILARYANPDRLTGGRSFDDPGGRGRWQFLGPDKNRLDFEGFREIFPSGGVVASIQPAIYFGAEPTHEGLRLKPQVPSSLTSVHFENFGYWRSLFDLTAEASRETVFEISPGSMSYPVEEGVSVGQSFIPSSPFNQVGLQVSVTPFETETNNSIRLVLEEEREGAWNPIATNWYNHLETNQWAFVTVDRILPAGSTYRIRATDARPAEGESLSMTFSGSDAFESGQAFASPSDPGLEDRDFALRVEVERRHLEVATVDNSEAIPFHLIRFHDGEPHAIPPSTENAWSVLLDPGEEVFLSATVDPVLEPRSLWRMF